MFVTFKHGRTVKTYSYNFIMNFQTSYDKTSYHENLSYMSKTNKMSEKDQFYIITFHLTEKLCVFF